MFLAAFFTIVKEWKQTKWLLIDEQINKVWYMCTVEYYLAIRRTKVLIQAITQTNLENIRLSRRSTKEKVT